MKKIAVILTLCATVILYSVSMIHGGQDENPTKTEGKLSSFVSILPQSFLVERIGGEHVRVQVLVQPGQDPHTFEPTPRQMVDMNESDVYFAIGLPFEEKILNKVKSSNPLLFVVYTDEQVKRRALEEHHRNDRGAEEGHDYEEHHHGELDPHIWLGPDETRMQARNIYMALIEYDPDHEMSYSENFHSFISELDEIDEKLSAMLAPYTGRSFFVFHPAFGYFADAYGLVQVPVEIEGKSPTPKQIESLIHEAREQDVRIIFVQPQFDKRSAETIASAIEGTVITIDPLRGDMLQNLEDIAQKIEASLH